MRIAINARMLQKGRLEGIGRYIYETTKLMVLNHPEDQFFLLFDRPYDKKYVFADNVIPLVLGPPTRHPILWKFWFERRIPKVLKKHKIDVFLSGDGYCSLSTDIPTAMVSHDLAFEHFDDHNKSSHLTFYRKYSPQYHKKAKQIIAVSEATKLDISKLYNIGSDKITVIGNAASKMFKPISNIEQEKTRQKYTEGEAYFLYLGSLHPRKNIVNLIKAFELFKQATNSTEKLVLVGRLAWKTEAINAALENSIFKKDIIHLNQIGDEISSIVASAKALVYVSLFEGFGIPILEAMQSGVPVICSNISSMPEVAGEAAILVDPHDVKEIATAISQVAKDDDLRIMMINKGIMQASTFSWDKSAEDIYACIKSLSVG